MHFQSGVVVAKPLEYVAAFFEEPANLAKWDQSVALVVPTSEGPPGVGFTFDTVAPSGMRMSYRVIEADGVRGSKVQLTSPSMFREAIWHMEFNPVAEGTRIICHVYFRLRALYSWLLLPLLLLQRRALRSDLASLKLALEAAPGYSGPCAG